MELISGLVAIVKFISFHARGCFNNGLSESLVAWQRPAVNMQAVLPWEQDDWWEEWDVPANSDQLTSGVNIMRSNRLETSSALEHKHSKMPIQNAHSFKMSLLC